MRKYTLTDLIMMTLDSEPATSYEIFAALPDCVRVIDCSQVNKLLKQLAKRGKIGRVAVNEKHGRNFVRSRYFKTHGGSNIVKIR